MEKQKRFVDTLRRWVDGNDAAHDPMDEISGHLPQRRMSEEFMVKVARSIETVLQDELFVPPRGAALVPARFIVYLNPIDNQSWRGAKRMALQQSLCDITFERASEMCKPAPLSVERIGVSLEEDRTLTQPGSYRVIAVWEADTEKAFAAVAGSKEEPTTSNFPAESTVVDCSFSAAATAAAKNITSDLPVPRLTVEVSHHGEIVARHNLSKPEVKIGRTSSTETVDIALPNEPKISRHHASLRIDEADKLWVTSQGTNATAISGTVVPRGVTMELPADGAVEICGYTLKFQVISQTTRSVKADEPASNAESERTYFD